MPYFDSTLLISCRSRMYKHAIRYDNDVARQEAKRKSWSSKEKTRSNKMIPCSVLSLSSLFLFFLIWYFLCSSLVGNSWPSTWCVFIFYLTRSNTLNFKTKWRFRLVTPTSALNSFLPGRTRIFPNARYISRHFASSKKCE